MKKSVVLAVLLSLISSVALAHSGHGLESAYAGFMHPLTGMDHLLVMLAIGLWAAKSNGQLRWQLPLIFVLSMALGAFLGASLSVLGGLFNHLETLIALTVLAIGALLIVRVALHHFAQLAIASTFALLHGMAHGLELQNNAQSTSLIAMMVATALLHAVGYWFGSQRQQVFARLQQVFAMGMVFAGAYLLAV